MNQGRRAGIIDATADSRLHNNICWERLIKIIPAHVASLALLLIATSIPGRLRAAASECDSRYFAKLQGIYVGFDDRVAGAKTGSGARIGLGRMNCGTIAGQSHWEVSLHWNSVDGAVVNDNFQAGLMLSRLRLFGNGTVRPFWQAGFGILHEELVAYKGYDPALDLGLGFLWRLTRGGVALRADVVVQGVFNDDDQVDTRFHHDGRLALGLMVPIGKVATPEGLALNRRVEMKIPD